MYAAYSDWMKYEIDESKRMGMPILGIVPYGQERIPLYVQQNATENYSKNYVDTDEDDEELE